MNSLRSTETTFGVLLTMVYAACVIWLSGFHEVWRDEVVVISMIKDAHSLPDLYLIGKHFGHPGLWQTILYFLYQIVPTYQILPVVNLTICILAISLFLKSAPFDRLFKVLFIFGALPVYVYPIVNRSYGLEMLEAFIICALYPTRWTHFPRFALALGLMSNVHAHMLLVAFALVASLCTEVILSKEVRGDITEKRGSIAAGCLILAALFGLTLYQIIPPADSLIFTPEVLSIRMALDAFVNGALRPGWYFHSVFGLPSTLFINALILASYCFLLARINLLVFFSATVIGLCMFFELIYPSGGLRHEGTLYLVMIMVMWMRYSEPDTLQEEKTGILHGMHRYARTNMSAFFLVILLIQISIGYGLIIDEIRRPYSSARAFAAFVQRNERLQDAILMGEPDGLLETMPYYLKNPIYFPRLKRFATYRRYSTEEARDFSLGDLLEAARRVHREHGKEVLILLGTQVAFEESGSGYHKLAFGTSYRNSAEDQKLLESTTDFLVKFDGAVMNENYYVYLLKDQPQ